MNSRNWKQEVNNATSSRDMAWKHACEWPQFSDDDYGCEVIRLLASSYLQEQYFQLDSGSLPLKIPRCVYTNVHAVWFGQISNSCVKLAPRKGLFEPKREVPIFRSHQPFSLPSLKVLDLNLLVSRALASKSSGVKRVGVTNFGVKSFGYKSFGVKGAGAKNAEIHDAEIHHPDIKNAVAKYAGAKYAGLNDEKYLKQHQQEDALRNSPWPIRLLEKGKNCLMLLDSKTFNLDDCHTLFII